MLQNLPYFWNKKNQIVFCLFFISSYFGFVTVNIDQTNCNQLKLARNETKKELFRFSYSKNMANFEAFLWSLSSSTNPEIVRSEYIGTYIYLGG